MARRIRTGAPRVPARVEKVELSDKRLIPRLIAAAVFLVVGASALAYAIAGFFTGESGWREIGTNSSDGISAAQDLVFSYNVGSTYSVSRENREITALYSEASRTAYELFSAELGFDGVNNLYELNRRPNEELEVDPALYAALEKICESGERYIYLGPVLEIYNGVFSSEFEESAADYDPRLNGEIAELFVKISEYANDPESVNIELLGDNRVKLRASGEYLAFLKSEELTRLADLGWMKNAFVVDYIAERLAEAGYTHGALSSFDGFSRNLGGEECSFTVYHLDGRTVYPAGTVTFSTPRSAVFLRNYKVSASDGENLRTVGGEPRTKYLSMADGVSREALPELTAYSDGCGCAEIALRLADIYISDSFDPRAALALTEEGIEAVYSDGRTLFYTASDCPLEPSDGFEAKPAGE